MSPCFLPCSLRQYGIPRVLVWVGLQSLVLAALLPTFPFGFAAIPDCYINRCLLCNFPLEADVPGEEQPHAAGLVSEAEPREQPDPEPLPITLPIAHLRLAAGQSLAPLLAQSSVSFPQQHE